MSYCHFHLQVTTDTEITGSFVWINLQCCEVNALGYLFQRDDGFRKLVTKNVQKKRSLLKQMPVDIFGWGEGKGVC